MPRRLIGIDLAWGEKNGTGCAELAWRGDELELRRIDVMGTLEEIVSWVEPQRSDWVVAVDAPLVVCNQTGRRQADADVSTKYGKFEAGAYPANLNNPNLGPASKAGRLLSALLAEGARLVDRAEDANSGRLIFEMYPHPAMVELFALKQTIKYKKGLVAQKRVGQRELADAIHVHLCAAGDRPRSRAAAWVRFVTRHLRTAADRPRLRVDPTLEDLLREPQEPLRGRALKRREDALDAVVCAYVAAWLDAGRPLQGLGEVGAGVVIAPQVHGIGE